MDIYAQLMRLTYRILKVYKDFVDAQRYLIIIDVLNQFNKYIEEKSNDWCELYDIVLGEEGIWEYSEDVYESIPEKEQEMWSLELCMLCCIIKFEINRNGDSSPQDMELREENIPEYVYFMENNFKTTDNYSACAKYWRDNICY